MKTTKTLSEILAKNLAYYVNNPKKRCINDYIGSCYYSGETAGIKTKGCFVGRFLKPADRIKADNNLVELADGDTSVEMLVECADELKIKIPKIISNNINLMKSFQILHDDDDNWDEKGLSNNGKEELEYIIKTNNLERKYFEKFLAE